MLSFSYKSQHPLTLNHIHIHRLVLIFGAYLTKHIYHCALHNFNYNIQALKYNLNGRHCNVGDKNMVAVCIF